jgi:sialic acid synthase SpsE
MLVAEISNVHFGSVLKARELIMTAYECGADLVKGQAFKAEDVAPLG